MFKCKAIPLELKVGINKKNFFKNLKKSILKNKPRILLLANPNQPVEVCLNLNQLKELAKITNNLKCFFLVDEAYFHFCNISSISLLSKFNNVVIFRTFSKAFGLAGLRVGYTLANEKIIKMLNSLRPIYEINNISIKICEYFLDNLQIMKDYVLQVKSSIKFIHKNLKNNNLKIYGDKSNNVLIETKNKKISNQIFQNLLKNKIFVNKINLNKKTFLRCTIGSIKTSKLLIKVIKSSI